MSAPRFVADDAGSRHASVYLPSLFYRCPIELWRADAEMASPGGNRTRHIGLNIHVDLHKPHDVRQLSGVSKPASEA
jgi:hypothetical protein